MTTSSCCKDKEEPNVIGREGTARGNTSYASLVETALSACSQEDLFDWRSVRMPTACEKPIWECHSVGFPRCMRLIQYTGNQHQSSSLRCHRYRNSCAHLGILKQTCVGIPSRGSVRKSTRTVKYGNEKYSAPTGEWRAGRVFWMQSVSECSVTNLAQNYACSPGVRIEEGFTLVWSAPKAFWSWSMKGAPILSRSTGCILWSVALNVNRRVLYTRSAAKSGQSLIIPMGWKHLSRASLLVRKIDLQYGNGTNLVAGYFEWIACYTYAQCRVSERFCHLIYWLPTARDCEIMWLTSRSRSGYEGWFVLCMVALWYRPGLCEITIILNIHISTSCATVLLVMELSDILPNGWNDLELQPAHSRKSGYGLILNAMYRSHILRTRKGHERLFHRSSCHLFVGVMPCLFLFQVAATTIIMHVWTNVYVLSKEVASPT